MNASFVCMFAVAAVCLYTAACTTHQARHAVAQQPDAQVSGMVAADHPIAAEAGAAMLRAGGNAVDAAVATSLTLSVVRPDACGIGGGGFMVIHLNDDPRHGSLTTAINYRETCPAAIGPTSYADWNDPEASRRGARAVAIPGTIAGLLHALDRYGTLDRTTVFAPAIGVAESGYIADEHHVRTARSLRQRFAGSANFRQRFPMVWERLMLEGDVEVGDRIHVPEQARALRLIAQHGTDAFYRGPIADAIVAAVAADGGVITHDDLAGYSIREVAPIVHEIGGSAVVAMPPPSSGGVAVVQMLDLANRVELAVPAEGWLGADSAHALVESMKHAFADRSQHMADPAFHDVPVDAMLADASLARTAQAVRNTVETNRTGRPNQYGVAAALEDDGGTSHIAVIDRHGNAVACTETINLAYGSLIDVQGFGFCLNNQMDDFTTIPGEANAFGLVQSDANLPEPGKRPLSSMSPTIVLDQRGEVVAVAGASGGPRIITSTLQVLLRGLRGGATAAEAVEAPRMHHQWTPNRVDLEPTQNADLAQELRDRGHDVGERDRIGAVQAIFRDPQTGALNGAADSRKGGGVADDSER